MVATVPAQDCVVTVWMGIGGLAPSGVCGSGVVVGGGSVPCMIWGVGDEGDEWFVGLC